MNVADVRALLGHMLDQQKDGNLAFFFDTSARW
jgi:hypothetical protein